MNIKQLLLAALAFATIAACGSKQTPANGDAQNDADSIFVEVDSIGISAALVVDGLAGHEQYREPLAEFVASQLFFPDDDEAQDVVLPTYEGNLSAFLQTCAGMKWDELREATFGDEADADSPTPEELAEGLVDEDGEKMYLTTYSFSLRKIFENDDYVTWQSDIEFFVQGTTGPGFAQSGITLAKADGKPLTSDILRDTDSEGFRQLLKEGVRQWVKTMLEMPADTDEDLQEVLFGERKINELVLPEKAPYLTSEGLVLPYQGMELLFTSEPQAIILPYDQVKPYLK